MGGLEVVEIHLAVEGGTILPPARAVEERADGAPLLSLLALPPVLVVCHRVSAPRAVLPAKPDVASRSRSREARLKPLSINRPEKHEATSPAPTPERRRRFEALPRPSRESCARWAQECADARNLVDMTRYLDESPKHTAILTRDIL